MRTGTLLIVLIILVPSISHAAQIFGTLRREGGAPVGGSMIEINCGGQIYEGKTDANGSYGIFVKRQEKCNFAVRYDKRMSKSVPIFSYSDPTRYDFELLPSGDLRRK